MPEHTEDPYNQRVHVKTLALPGGKDFIILSHRSATEYAVERYDADLKKVWTAAVPVTADESLEAFARNDQQALVVVHNKDETGQHLLVQPINLGNGQKLPAKKMAEAGPRERRPGVSISPDGTHVVAWRYVTRDEQIKSLTAAHYDRQLNKLKDRTYDFRDLGSFFSPTVQVANDGTQYVALIGDNNQKLTVRRYRDAEPDVKAMSVAVGGTFGGKKVTVRDTQWRLLDGQTLYAATICADYASGDFYSLKLVKFDFANADMKFAPESRFTPEYLAEVNKATGGSAKRLDDVYLSDVVRTADQNVVVVAEKKAEEGPDAPVRARELHVFGYNEFQSPTWHSIIAKNQQAPITESFTGIGYRAAAIGNDVQVVTLEKLKDKTDLYLRKIAGLTGVVSEPKGIGLNVANDQQLAYVKDFTTWLDDKTMIVVTRPSKKSAALQLNKLVFK
ncbi:hypothetical protein F0P96_15155 [Hymenobacter busanensis]|uniref:Uncharacterized protein n=1 Tax=Hymenobacter busanensis TaxID=2607656 RepID=A0A7L5A160_9BACT|nr:hypothetical protein [Hymenobacter busanensis]KAA9331572.1 hypothetical protein F0P96_15155 [Hymenobacter busanensis]QHJ08725.1 hypothetical protein GUY19_16090 [Hymenobacter busanensis]